MNRVSSYIVLCLFFAVSGLRGYGQNQAQATDSIPTPFHIPLDEITVQAFRYEHPLIETPGAVSLISAGQLRQTPGQSIASVISMAPGVLMQSGSLNTNRLSIRGMGSRSPYASNKVRAYFEDIPLTNGVGETTIEDLDLHFISGLEIIKGPASGYYGSGLGGTLLFHAPKADRNILLTESTLSSFNTQLHRANLSLANKKLQQAFYAEQLTSKGYRENNQTDRTNFSYIGKLCAGQHLLNLIAAYTDLMAYIPSSIDREVFNHSPKQAAANWAAIRGYEDYRKLMAGLSVQSDWKNELTTRFSLFAHTRENDELRPFNTLDENNNYIGGRWVVEKKMRLSDRELKLTIGNESFFERYNWSTYANEGRERGNLLSNNQEKRRYINLFTQAQYALSARLNLVTGLNVNQTSYRYQDRFLTDGDQSARHRFDRVISPRLAFNYALRPQSALYGTLSHGFSPPSLEETLMPDGQRNTGIKPESGWNYELGSRGVFMNGLFYDISVYYMQVKNLLVARRTAEDAFIGVNAGKTAHPGLEYALKYRFLQTRHTSHQLSINGSFTPHYFVDFVDEEADYSDNDLTGVPRHQLNLTAGSNFKKNLQISLQYSYVGAMPLRDDASVYSDAYQLFHLTGSYKKQWKQLELDLSGAVYNLTDTRYASMVLINASAFGNQLPRYYYPGLPRNFSARIRLSYSF
ncbi:TonB-dependent receptor [Gaoshiqia sp. Z1-71]|uniref:TonB-dependent receptor n=1 Tax=Gaoshiqia hydrogeniformans TaxID=3290090 RepID=UPI003BF7A236